MKRITLFLILISFALAVKGQNVADSFTFGKIEPQVAPYLIIGSNNVFHADTVAVIAYYQVKDTVFSWRKMYAVNKWGSVYVFNNTLYLYPLYLEMDRKTTVKNKVIYAINQ